MMSPRPDARMSARVALALWAGWLGWATLSPAATAATGNAQAGVRLDLVPLHSIERLVELGFTWPVVRLLAGNVAVFIPFGLLAPMAWPRTRSLRATVLAGLVVSLGIECGQLAISLGFGYAYRVAEVDDVLLNVAGVSIGFLLARATGVARPVVAASPPGCYCRHEPRTPG